MLLYIAYFPQWSKCVGTSRYGIILGFGDEWVTGINDWAKCNTAISDPEWYGSFPHAYPPGTFADAVSRLFSEGYFTSYEPFASTKHNPASGTINHPGHIEPLPPPPPPHFLSLEYIHNVVHVSIFLLFLLIRCYSTIYYSSY